MTEPIDINRLQEGCLYTVKGGELLAIKTDPDDVMKKVKITESALNEVIALQRRLRREMQGYKPDVHLICSALIEHVATIEGATDIVRGFCLRLFASKQDVEKTFV